MEIREKNGRRTLGPRQQCPSAHINFPLKNVPQCVRVHLTQNKKIAIFLEKRRYFFSLKILFMATNPREENCSREIKCMGKLQSQNSCLASFGLVRCRSSPAAPPPPKKNDPSSASERKGKRIPGHEIREKRGRGKC